MKIRNGIYTEYEGKEYKLLEVRQDVPTPLEEKKYHLWLDETLGNQLEDFIKSKHGNGYYKVVFTSEISDAFLINTYGFYQNLKVEIFESKEEGRIKIATHQESTGECFGFDKINTSWFVKKVHISEMELMWEEKTTIVFSPNSSNFYEELNRIWNDKNDRMRKVFDK